MAIIYAREIPKERTATGNYKDGYKYKRAFFVRTDSPTESLTDISNAPGIAFQDLHPNDASAMMQTYDIKPADDSGLLYVVTFDYEKFNPDDREPPAGEPGGMDFKPPVWGGSSSVTTGPVYEDVTGLMIVNTANDPLEGLEKEYAEERLTLTQYYATHTQWMALSREYTNAVNNATWNGGAIRTWKCQGASKKLNIETKDGATIVYWEVTWDFAYRADGWDLKPWNIGFNELAIDPETGGYYARKTIKGLDGRPVKQPVALDSNGLAKTPGEAPDALSFQVYESKDFSSAFGQLFTPG